MLNNPRKVIFRIFGLIIFISILLFAYGRYSRYIKGPEIVTINIQKFTTIENPSLILETTLENTKSVTINGRDIILNNRKNFNEIMVFSLGTNILEIELTDTFGKTKTYIYNIFYKGEKIDYPKTLNEAKAKQEEQALIELELELELINQ